jgi:ankyrin repeat protein
MDINEQLLNNIEKNNIDEVIKLLNKGADINYNNGKPLDYGIDTKDYQMVKLLLDMGANMDNGFFLSNTCENNNSEIVELLLKEGIDCNEHFDTLVESCIYNDNGNNLSLLIEYGIIQIQMITNQEIYFEDTNKYMLIWDACLEKKKKNILEFIINHYPEIIPNDINTSLIEQQYIQKYNFIKMLINRNLIDVPD